MTTFLRGCICMFQLGVVDLWLVVWKMHIYIWPAVTTPAAPNAGGDDTRKAPHWPDHPPPPPWTAGAVAVPDPPAPAAASSSRMNLIGCWRRRTLIPTFRIYTPAVWWPLRCRIRTLVVQLSSIYNTNKVQVVEVGPVYTHVHCGRFVYVYCRI